MRQGRVSFWTIAVVACVLAIFVLFFLGRESPGAASTKFLSALAELDLKTVTETSVLPGESQEELRKQWQRTLEVAKYYRWSWKIVDTTRTTPEQATVKLRVWRNLEGGASYDEPFELQLLKKDGRWKVDVSQLSREMFPALPS